MIAIQVEKNNSIKELVLRLKESSVLRFCCSFDVLGPVPFQSTFSRFINELSDSLEFEELFYDLVIRAKELGIIDGKNISIDSTKLDSYEAAKAKKDIIDDGTNPNWDMKRDTNSNNIRWFGWKVHIICDSKSELPLDILVSPASSHDAAVALPLIEQFFRSYQDSFKSLHYR